MEKLTVLMHINTLSYIGLFGVSLLSNVFIPIPEEIILLTIGYAVAKGKFSFLGAIIVVLAGSFVIDLLMFALSKSNNRFILWFYQKVFSKVFPIKHDLLVTHAEKLIFLSRFLVQLRFLGPFIAGQVKVSWKKFMIYDFLALTIYVVGFIGMGTYFAKSIDKIISGVHVVQHVVLLVVIMFAIWSVAKIIHSKFLEEYVS